MRKTKAECPAAVVMQIDCLVAGNEGLPLLGVALGLYVSAVLFFNGS